jgi:tetratricopeptide (TPR) repeat protein
MAKNWQECYEQGRRAFEERNYKEAQKKLEEVLKVKDSFADVYNMLGVVCQIGGKVDEAIDKFKKALDINPGYTEASLNLAVTYNEKGEFGMAEQVYLSAKEKSQHEKTSYLDPYVKGKLANMHAELGSIYRDLGFYSEAVDEYKMALALRANFVDIKNNLGISYRGIKDFSRAIKEFKEVIKINPNYSSARLQLGITYYLMNQNERARAQWLRVLRDTPNDVIARMYMNLVKKTD